MSYKIAKLMLEQAGTFMDRAEAVRVALSLGMPLNEIEEYLDWLDMTRVRSRDPLPPKPDKKPDKGPNGEGPNGEGPNGER
jgi:hypothetical protein